MWADSTSGLPLRVEVYGDDQDLPVLSSRVISLDLTRPSKATPTSASPPVWTSSATWRSTTRRGPMPSRPTCRPTASPTSPGWARRLSFGAVGVYGRGPTAILAIPLRDFVAQGLREQLRKSTQSRDLGDRIALEVGPISVLLARVAGGNFLITGTVTPATLDDALADLDAGVERTVR